MARGDSAEMVARRHQRLPVELPVLWQVPGALQDNTGILPEHGQLDRKALVPPGDHLGGIAAGHAQQVVTRLRVRGEELNPDPRLHLGAVLAGTPPGDLAPDQRRAAAPSETDATTFSPIASGRRVGKKIPPSPNSGR